MVGKLRILFIKKHERMMNEKINILMDTVVLSRERERCGMIVKRDVLMREMRCLCVPMQPDQQPNHENYKANPRVS